MASFIQCMNEAAHANADVVYVHIQYMIKYNECRPQDMFSNAVFQLQPEPALWVSQSQPMDRGTVFSCWSPTSESVLPVHYCSVQYSTVQWQGQRCRRGQTALHRWIQSLSSSLAVVLHRLLYCTDCTAQTTVLYCGVHFSVMTRAEGQRCRGNRGKEYCTVWTTLRAPG